MIYITNDKNIYLNKNIYFAKENNKEDYVVYNSKGNSDIITKIAEEFKKEVVFINDEKTDMDLTESFLEYQKKQLQFRKDYLVVVLEEDALLPALVFSYHKNAKLVIERDYEKIASIVNDMGVEYLALIGSISDFTFKLIENIKRIVDTKIKIGSLVSKNVDKLCELIFKNLFYTSNSSQKSTFLAPIMKTNDDICFQTLKSYFGENCSLSLLKDMQEMDKIFSIITHGKEDYLRLDDGLICAKCNQNPFIQSNFKRAIPACMQGQICCKEKLDRISVNEIKAQVIFANACLTMKFNKHLFNSDFTISQQFIDGWAGFYIASPLLKAGLPFENLLFNHMIENGYSIGQAVEAVNQNLYRIGLDAPAFFIIGDPEARFNNCKYNEFKSSDIEVDASYEKEPYITIRNVTPAFLEVDLGESLLDKYREGNLGFSFEQAFGGKEPYYVCFYDTDKSLKLFIVGLKDKYQKQFTINISDKKEYSYIVDTIDRFENLSNLDIKIRSAKKTMNELKNYLPKLNERLNLAQVDITEIEKSKKAILKYQKSFSKLDNELLSTLLKRTESESYHFIEAYQPTYLLEFIDTYPEDCPYCGEVIYQYNRRNLTNEKRRRIMHSCPVCGVIRDGDDLDIMMNILGESKLEMNSVNSFELEIINNSQEEYSLLVGCRITKGLSDNYKFGVLENVTIEAYENKKIPLSIEVEEPKVNHPKLLRVYGITRGKIYFAGRDLWF